VKLDFWPGKIAATSKPPYWGGGGGVGGGGGGGGCEAPKGEQGQKTCCRTFCLPGFGPCREGGDRSGKKGDGVREKESPMGQEAHRRS